ncbi:hypothetical protein [Desulfamplus magnetovallimortis]|nr:hypothetical protein [Desulfamplus magnetovallimortis]
MKTAICGDFHITYMADFCHNRRDESRFKNRLLPRLSYKHTWQTHLPQRSMKILRRLESRGLSYKKPTCD